MGAWCTLSAPPWTRLGPGAAPVSLLEGSMSLALREPAPPPALWMEALTPALVLAPALPPALLAAPSLWTATPASVTPKAWLSVPPLTAVVPPREPLPPLQQPPPPPPVWPQVVQPVDSPVSS